MSYKLRILSLGAGVQSTTLLLMAEKGLIEPFHCAIFADTGWESEATYTHLNWLKQVCKTPIIIVRSELGSILDWSKEAMIRNGKKFCVMPFYTLNSGKKGILRRQCTDHFKITPIRKHTRKLLGLIPHQKAPKGAVEQCVGISTDESQRIKISREKMTDLSYPLVKMRYSRTDCQQWLNDNYKIVVPKSSCVGCPFHTDKEWLKIKANQDEWNQAIELDNIIRLSGINHSRQSGMVFLHSSCKPLEEVDFRSDQEILEQDFGQQTLFNNWIKDEKLNLFVKNLSIVE